MKRFIFIGLVFLLTNCAFANNIELSKQATAFYSDNNRTKTMDLILQIDEKERTAQDWLILGNVLADSGQVNNAVFMYQKAISTDKKCYRAYYNLANYYAENGKFIMAEDNYKKALSIKKDNPYIFYNLACVNIKQNNFKSARANLNKAITLKSDVPEFHYNLAYVYKNLNKPKLAETYLNNYNKLTENY